MSSTKHRLAPAVILYDGVCGLCNRTVRFVLKHDREGIFRFASLQSTSAREILARHGIAPDAMDTLYLVTELGQAGERVLSKSAAALRIAALLRGIWKAAGLLRFLPRFIRDAAYDTIARHRYRWFGKYQSCPLPEARYRDRFIE